MKTAVISDLHLGLISGGDGLRDPEIRAVLAAELRGADRLVLLGDAIELRERPDDKLPYASKKLSDTAASPAELAQEPEPSAAPAEPQPQPNKPAAVQEIQPEATISDDTSDQQALTFKG